MKKIFGILVVFIGLLVTSLPVLAEAPARVSYGIRVEKFSTGGTFNMSKQQVVAPAIGYVNTSGQAPLVGYYSHRRSTKMIPRHDGEYKKYDRKTVKRVTKNKTQYRDADSTRKTRYKTPEYRNKTLEAYN